jgi:uncharacterized membrane protein YbhN (UPF0104 family)
VLPVVLAALVYGGYAAYTGFGRVATELRTFRLGAAAAALALAALNYGLRFAKWELYLRRLDVRVPLAESARIFLSGFALTVTPGKIGEALKAYLLREAHGVPMARTAPTVLAERLTDLIALITLALTGAGALGARGRLSLGVAAAVVLGFIGCVSSRRCSLGALAACERLPGLRRHGKKLREFYGATAVLLEPAPLVQATLLSLVAWTCECVAFYLVLRGFGGGASLRLCTFIYAAMTVAGALSFLPGGLGLQEVGMVQLLLTSAHGVTRSAAFAATFVTRVCTLWFAVAVGLAALLWQRRRVSVDLAALVPTE